MITRFDGLELGDFRCRARAGTCSGEEDSPTDAIAFVRRGVFERRIGARTSVGAPSQILYYPMGVAHRTRHPAHGGDDCTVLSVDRALLVEVRRSVTGRDDDARAPLAREACPLPARLHLAQWRALRRCASGAIDPVEAHERVLALLFGGVRALLDAPPAGAAPVRASTQRAHRDLAHDAALLLASRCSERWTLDALAEEVCSSPFHLARVFKREMGLPIHRWLLGLRLREGVSRLAAGAGDLTALALDLGFASRGHFSDAFCAEYRESPSALRRELRTP